MKNRTYIGRRSRTTIDLATPDEVTAYLRELAGRLGKDTLSTKEVKEDGRISPATIIRRFGGFSDLLIKAGLRPQRAYRRDPDQMLRALSELVTRIGRQPSKTEIQKNLSYTARQYVVQFGSIQKACELAHSQVCYEVGPADPRPSPFEVTLEASKRRRRYGRVLNFRGLRHAPINEQGVVFLFGMLASELGFVVESVQGGFPDCDAKLRRKDGTFE